MSGLDMDGLLARCLGNLEFAERVLVMFQQRGHEELAELESAVATADKERVVKLAHRLKGASANASAHGLRARAAEMEQAARQDAAEDIPSRLEELKGEWRRFESAVERLSPAPESTT